MSLRKSIPARASRPSRAALETELARLRKQNRQLNDLLRKRSDSALASELERTRSSPRETSHAPLTGLSPEKEERLRLAIECAQLGTWDWDIGAGELVWSDRCKALFAIPREMNMTYERFAAALHPEDRARTDEAIVNALYSRTTYDIEFRTIWPDGTLHWVASTGRALYDSDGRPCRMIGVARDITERKFAEEKLHESENRAHLAIAAAGMGTWDWNLVTKSVKWSPQHNRLLGIDPAIEEGNYEIWAPHVHPDDIPLIQAELHRVIDERIDLTMEYRSIWPDGSVHWIAAYGRPVFDHDGKPIRMLGLIRDVTERKRTEETLREQQRQLQCALTAAERAREEAEAAGRAKDHFLAVLSHELRTPLTPVLMAVSAMQSQERLSEAMRDALQMIRRNVQLEARLIDDLLDLVRIARGKMELTFAPVNLHDAVTRALEICAADLSTKWHRLDVQLHAQRHRVAGDFARLQQVFWNLIKNAVKFTPAGGGITIRSENSNGAIRIEIADTGIGIEPEALPRIFNPFEQGSQQIERQFGGLGLGLAISKATIDAHHGKLTVESAGKNLGSIFRVELSLKD